MHVCGHGLGLGLEFVLTGDVVEVCDSRPDMEAWDGSGQPSREDISRSKSSADDEYRMIRSSHWYGCMVL